MRKRHFKNKIETSKNMQKWRGRQNEDNETHSSKWFVTWRRLHNV